MTDEERIFPQGRDGRGMRDEASISELSPQPVMEFEPRDAAPSDRAGADGADAPLEAAHFAAGAPAPDPIAAAAHLAEPTAEPDEGAWAPAALAAAPEPAVSPAPVASEAPYEPNPHTEAAHFADPDPDAVPGAAHFAGPEPDAEPGAAHFADPGPEPDAAPEAAHFADPEPEAAPAGAHAAASEPSEPAAPMGAHAAESGSAAQEDILGLEDTGSLPEPEVVAAAAEAARKASPEDTAEIDVAQVEAQLKDPGTTQSFAPLTEERIPTDSTYDAGTTTSLMWGARSDVGCVRSHNEDSYLVASPLFAVCDGMGGHAAGEVASSIAVETIARTSPGTADAAQLAAAVEAANAAIIEAAASGIGRPGMGCTATVAYIEGTTIAIAHVGDSRAYLLHEGVLTRVTRDHSYVEELVDAGEITADEARVHPNRSVITRALGSDPGMYADHFTLNIVEGDRLILCSDGLSSMISDSEIEDIAVKSSTAQMCTDNLVDAALAAGGADNVSVVVVDVVDDGRLKQVVRTHRRNIAIALGALVALVLAAAIALFVVISNSVYLGVDGDTVAVYQGIPTTVLGVELHHVQEETSIKLSDLPEDTQNRLREGIAQGSLEQARDTISDYRRQIDEARSQQAATAEAIRESAPSQDQAGTDAASGAGTDPAADAAATGETADPAAADPAAAGAAQTQNPEGGA